MKITIIGVGNLGGAIACGLAKGSFTKAENITCVDQSPIALEKMKATGFPFKLTSDLRKAVVGADILVLAVKPFAAEEVIAQCRDHIDPDRQIFFSAVAGLTFAEIDRMLAGGKKSFEGKELVHFRIMPNIAIAISESFTFIAARNANAAQVKLAETMFNEMGQTMVIPESKLAAAMAVGSCAIAFVMRFVRAGMMGAVEAGFSAADSHAIVLQVIKGATKLLLENGQHPEVEIDRVTTPGGYTIRGLNAMEENGFTHSVVSGIRASYENGK
jgi:pyrroline-5-carboxylate reductase